jgi:hypothetical protein
VPAVAHVWGWFLELSERRVEGRLGWLDLRAGCAMLRIRPTGAELHFLGVLERAYQQARAPLPAGKVR